MRAHALTARISQEVPFPFVTLLISGGHCILAQAQGLHRFRVLGESVDDSPGEVLDKVARMLKLHNLPGMRDVGGGRAVEMVAQRSREAGEEMLELNVPMRHYRDCRFSFSGIKAQVFDFLSASEASHDGQPLPEAGSVCQGVLYCLSKHLCERLQRGLEFLGEEGR